MGQKSPHSLGIPHPEVGPLTHALLEKRTFLNPLLR